MKIAIVENERVWQQAIKEIVKKYNSNFKVDLYPSGDDFLEVKQGYDIVFMDIEMQGLNGLETCKEYEGIYPQSKIIIATSHLEMSRQGYLVNAFRFIDKTCLDEINEALMSAIKIGNRNKKIRFQVENRVVYIAYNKILYFESFNRKIYLHTIDDKIELKRNLSDFIELLKKDGFYNIHRSYLVNMDHVKIFKNYEAVLVNTVKLPISHSKYGDFKEKCLEWKFEKCQG